MSFANAHLLWLIPTLFLLGVVIHFFGRYQQRRLSGWIARANWKNIIPEYSDWIFRFRGITLTLALVLIGFAAARPQWGEREDIIQSNGMDVLFLLDLSNSMLAEDISPSRLSRAQTLIKKSLEQMGSDRVGIIGFAGSAYLAAPLTTDFGYIAEIADTLDPNAISNQGTNIGLALDVGMKAFERSAEDNQKTSRAFVLISDGEDFGEDAKAAAEKIKDFGAGFFVFSVGTKEGAPIPIRNESGVLQTYKKDNSSKPILSRVNPALLNQIADSGGGKFMELVNADDAAYQLVRQLKGLSQGSLKEQRQVTKIDRFIPFLIAGTILLVLNLLLGYRLKSLAVLFVMISFSPVASAQSLDSYFNSKQGKKLYLNKDYENSASAYEAAKKDDPESPTLEFNQGTALAQAKRNEEAVIQFQNSTKKSLAAGDYEMAAKSLYNEGVAQNEIKNLPAAYDRLSKAIEMAKISKQPELEKMAREALSSMVEKQKQQQKQDQNKQDDQQKKQEDQKKQEQKETPKDPSKDGQKKPQDAGKNRQFQSGTLSKDVAESVMNDLSDREKQLYRKRMKERKSKETNHEKDW